MIIVVFGLPGSGKSFFARHFAEKIAAKYLSSDTIRSEVLPSKSYSTEEKYRIYDVMLERCAAFISEGRDVVLDATFYRDSVRQKVIDLAKNVSCRIEFIEVWADEHLVKERVSQARKDSDADFDVYIKIRNEFEALELDHLKLESTQSNIEEMLQLAMKYLKMQI